MKCPILVGYLVALKLLKRPSQKIKKILHITVHRMPIHEHKIVSILKD